MNQPRKSRSIRASKSRVSPDLSEEAFDIISARFRALAEPMRLKILHALGDAEVSVTELVKATGAGQANVSKHLSVLLDSHLVSRRKDGLNVLYRVSDESVFDLCEAVCKSVGDRLVAQHAAVRKFSGR